MNLYVQYYNPEGFDYRAALPNSNIRIVRFHTQIYRGFQKSRILAFPPRAGKRQFRNGGADRRIRRSAAGV